MSGHENDAGGVENAGPANTGPEMKDQISRHENAGPANAGPPLLIAVLAPPTSFLSSLRRHPSAILGWPLFSRSPLQLLRRHLPPSPSTDLISP